MFLCEYISSDGTKGGMGHLPPLEALPPSPPPRTNSKYQPYSDFLLTFAPQIPILPKKLWCRHCSSAVMGRSLCNNTQALSCTFIVGKILELKIRGRVKKSLQPSFFSSHGCIYTKVAVSTSNMNLRLSCHVTWTVLHAWLHYGIGIKTMHFGHY